jgi:hypothetical protein
MTTEIRNDITVRLHGYEGSVQDNGDCGCSVPGLHLTRGSMPDAEELKLYAEFILELADQMVWQSQLKRRTNNE